jgi:hypothetical protein
MDGEIRGVFPSCERLGTQRVQGRRAAEGNTPACTLQKKKGNANMWDH